MSIVNRMGRMALAAGVAVAAAACASDGVTAPVASLPQLSVSEALQERVKGVRITPQPPGPMRIRICNFTGERMVGRPLFIVDGAVLQHSVAHGLNPNEIATIHVLKGAEAMEIYGPEARDGAVIVRTKAGAGTAAAPDPAAR